MEQARRLKQVARERQANAIRMGVPLISDNTKLTFSHITEKEWTWEIEKYCGRALSKSLVRHLCQDTEVVPADIVPTLNYSQFQKFSPVLKKPFLDILAIRIQSEQDFNMIMDNDESKNQLKKLCPVTFKAA